jgi:ribosomal protein S6--L-glutamate ligase
MKIAVLSHNFNAYSNRRFTEAARERGHQMQFIYISNCYMNITDTPPKIYYRGAETLDNIDAIIPRIQPAHSFYGTAVLRQFELIGVYALNSALAITWTRDKFRTLQLLARKKVPLPITGFADSPEETEKLIQLVGGAPLIIRVLEGSKGQGTIFAETHVAAVSVINAFKQLKTNILVQECIQEANSTDIRCIVLGTQVIAAMHRSVFESDTGFPHHKNLSSAPIQITKAEEKIAIRAAKAMKLHLASVDLIRSHRGPLVLDIDSAPSIEMLEKITQCDITSRIIEFLEKNLK